MGGVLDLRPLAPAAIVAVTGLVVLLAQAFTPKGKESPSAALSLAGLAAALASVWLLAAGPARGTVMAGAVTADELSLFLHALILGIAAAAVLLSPSYLRTNGMEGGEYYALLLFSTVGMLGLVSSLELVSIFVALEIMSIALYGMAGMDRRRVESQEAALKYFVTGAFASAFLLYGIALLYGVSGSTQLEKVQRAVAVLSPESSTLAVLGVAMLLVGFGFKVGSVPFHMWVPDVYEGAPTPATAFMSAGVKAAAFGALLRVFDSALPALAAHWRPLVAVLAIVTMVVGNLAALAQTNLKRMLAYSSVAHAGYVLTALVAAPIVAGEAVLFYLVAYAAVNLGAFGAIAALAREGREPLALRDVAGLAERRPALAAALASFLVSLTGIPVTAGFVGKFYLFNAAVSVGRVGVMLALVGVVMSVVSAYYYLRVVVAMYMRDPVGEDDWSPVSPAASFTLAAAAALTIALGVWPSPMLTLARLAARSLAF
ncbi:MAG TPA: NADH-quinone oxidoreductase subunit N [Vicinamibacteria bacterium]|nr:NADH-quinone oxidoreductase subunit N [Vicinamibacteria bacterium]